MNGKKIRKIIRVLCAVIGAVVLIFLANYIAQRFWAHRNGCFVPEYEKVTLTEHSDYEEIFQQTGIGKVAAEKLIRENKFQTILDAQEMFFKP